MSTAVSKSDLDKIQELDKDGDKFAGKDGGGQAFDAATAVSKPKSVAAKSLGGKSIMPPLEPVAEASI
jgi:hypothetical protein